MRMALDVPEDLLEEEVLLEWVDLFVRLVEAAGALIIFLGAAIAFVRFVRAVVRPADEQRFTRLRLAFGRYLVLGLEFQLASDVLSTAVAPSFEEIGKLAAIATIRTALAYFLNKEIAAERAEIAERPSP